MHVHFSATQMWCLGRLLPLIIGEKIEKDDGHWLNFLRFLMIMDYVFAPILSPDCIDHLKVLIKEHHQTWKELYPTLNITPTALPDSLPRMHREVCISLSCIGKYFMHLYVHLIRFGPPVRFWCMRFEGKHSYFKDLAHRILQKPWLKGTKNY